MPATTTHYLEREGAQIAYQVLGRGQQTLLVALELTQHPDLMWADPHMHAAVERASRLRRVVCMQQRGVGLSDPVPYVPTLEQMADDLAAVMDAVKAASVVLVAFGTACSAAALVAARRPERIEALVLVQPFAQGTSLPADELVGWDPGSLASVRALLADALDGWGQGRTLDSWDAQLASSEANRRVTATLERTSMTPSTARAVIGYYLSADFRDVFRSVSVRTYVLRFSGAVYPEPSTRLVADLIPGSVYRRLPDLAPGSTHGESAAPILDFVETLAADGGRHSADRFLAALLFTDVVDSTGLIARLGNAEYQRRFAAHARSVRASVERFGGDLQQIKGDGTFSAFGSAADAMRAADAIGADAGNLGVRVRAGVHSGDVERGGPELTGLNVHIAARVCAAAQAGEVLVTRAAAELARGAGIAFAPRGDHALKGVDGLWPLSAVDPNLDVVAIPADPPAPPWSDRALLALARRAPRLVRRLASVDAARRQRVAEP